MENKRYTIRLNSNTYLQDIQLISSECFNRGIILITTNLPKKSNHERKHWTIQFNPKFGYLYLGAWVAQPDGQKLQNIQQLFYSIDAQIYTKHSFDKKHIPQEYVV